MTTIENAAEPQKTIQIAKLFVDLDAMRTKIYNEILPACQHLAADETSLLAMKLEQAAVAIEALFEEYRLAMEARK